MKSIEDLLNYSNLINNLNLESKSIHYIIWLEEEYIEDDLIDPNSADFQSLLIDSEEKKLKLIIRNFDKAIKSQCDNINLDLDKHDKDTYWNYSYTKESEKLRLSQRFAINKLIPNDEKVFKELWLRNFINIISKIAKNIREIINIESEKKIAKTQKNYYEYYWFKIGVLFATGEIYTLLEQNDSNSTEVAKFLGNKNLRPYISDSLGSNLKSDKNIFSSYDKMIKVISYCEENKLAIKQDFKSKLPPE